LDPSQQPWLWAAVAVLVLAIGCQALVAYWESAVISARRSRLAQFAPEGSRRLRAAEALLDHPERFEAAAQVGETVAEALGYAAATLIAVLLTRWPPGPLELGTLGELGLRVGGALLVTVALVLLVGEILPKAAATRAPERAILRWAGTIRIFTLVWTPAVLLLGWLGRTLAGVAGTLPVITSRSAHTEEEIKILVEGSAEEGVLEEEEKEMIHSIFEFTDMVARQVMVPRIDMATLPADATVDDALRLIEERGHSRVPVYEETVDRIVGIVHAKDLLRPLREGRFDVPLQQLMREPIFVPEGKKLDELLQEFRAAHAQMAIVVDEFGGTSGLVTLEDVLEEIVGEIQDEYDREESPIVQLDATTAIVDARLNLVDVNEALGLSLPAEQYDTLGGLVLGLFGRTPEVGEHVSLDGTEFVVEAADGPRLLKIRVSRPPAPEAEESPG